MPHAALDVGALRAFLDDQVEFFDWSLTSMLTIPRARLDSWHLAGIQLRFAELRERVPVLRSLADGMRLDEIRTLDDAVPLLFEHTIYKSYPASFLRDKRFDRITQWLGKLTSHDLSGVDTAGCEGIDDWVARMDAESPLVIANTSGTTGSVSFLPWSKDEFDRWGKQLPVTCFQRVGDPRPANPVPGVHVICPYFRSGTSVILRQNENFVKYVAGGDESRFQAAFPHRLSADLTSLAARVRIARATGQLEQLDIPSSVMERLGEFDRQQQAMMTELPAFLLAVTERLQGERVFLGAVWSLLYPVAEAGRQRGLKSVFAPDSVVLSGGGAKGVAPPPDWKETVAEFVGVEHITMQYAMSEVGAGHPMCSQGHYHLLPTVIPFVLDPDTSEPLPRKGTVTGRAAFFDLLPDSRWGGIITGDEVTLHWDEQCACGATTAFVDDTISRYSDKRGGDDKITCAAQPEVYAEALNFLVEG